MHLDEPFLRSRLANVRHGPANGELRRKNNQQLADLRFKTEEKILWNGPFLHWGKEESMFADVRNYIYHGKKIDQQVHLGFDLSDTMNAPLWPLKLSVRCRHPELPRPPLAET